MNNLNISDSEGYKIYEDHNNYNRPPIDEGLIGKKLPPEVFEKVLSCLDDINMHQALLVSRFWGNAVIDTEKHKEFSKIKSFVEFLNENLKEESYTIEKGKLLNIFSKKEILNSGNFIQVKSSIHSCKEDVLNTLKNLIGDDLEKLEALSKNEPKPKFFENVFDLARIYKKIDEAGKISYDLERDDAFRCLSKALVQSGSFHKAIEVAEMISSDLERNDAFRYLSTVLVRSGDIEKAIEVAEMISSDTKRWHVLQSISYDLGWIGRFDKAIEVAEMIPDDIDRGGTFRIYL